MSATEDRVDIVVVDRVSEEPAKKIQYLGKVAREAHAALKDMKASLREIDSSAVRKLQKEMADGVNQNVRAAAALERLQQQQARTALGMERVATQQAKTNNVMTQGAVVQQRLTNAQTAGERASTLLARANLNLQATQDRIRRGAEQAGDAMVRMYQKVDAARRKEAAGAAQADINALLGVRSAASMKGSARASASAFATADEQAKEMSNLQRRAESLRGAIDPLYAAQAAFNRTQAEANTLLSKGVITQAEHARIVGMATQAMHAATGATGKMGDATKLTRFQMLTLQYTINDVVASLASGASPMTILMQQGGQVTQAWGGLLPTLRAAGGLLLSAAGIITSVVTAGVGMLLFLDNADAELKKIDRQLQNTGGYAGLTAGQFMVMSDSIAAATRTSVSSAREVAMVYASSGRFQQQQIEQISVATVNFARRTDQSTEAVEKSFMSLAEGPSKALAELNQRYGFLTASQYVYVKGLEDAGRQTDALAAATKILYDYYGKEAPQNLGYVEAAWRGIGNAISDAWTALKNFGRTQTVQEQLKAAMDARAELEKNLSTGIGMGRSSDQHKVDALNVQIENLREAVRLENKAADAATARAQAEKDGIRAVQQLDSYSASIADNSVKAQKAIDAFRKSLADAPKDSEQYKFASAHQSEIEEGIRKKFMPEAAKQSRQQARDEESVANAVARVEGEMQKELNALGLTSVEREKSNKIAEIEIKLRGKGIEMSEAWRAELVQQIDLIAEAKRRQTALNAVYEEFRGPGERYRATLSAIDVLLDQEKITQGEASRARAAASESYQNAIDPMREYNRQLDDEAKLLGFVGTQLDVATRIQAIEQGLRAKGVKLGDDERAQLTQKIKDNIEAAKRQRALGQYYAETQGAADDLRVQQIALTQAFERGYIGVTQYGYGIADLEGKMAQLRITMGQGDWLDALKVAFVNNIGRMEDALVDFTLSGKLNVKDMVKSMLADFMRLSVVRPLMGNLLSGLFGGGGMFSSGASGGGLGGMVGSVGTQLVAQSMGLPSMGTLLGGFGAGSSAALTTANTALVTSITGDAASAAAAAQAAGAAGAGGSSLLAGVNPYAAAAVAALVVGKSLFSGGETRSGAEYNGAVKWQGPSGGEINGDATRTAIQATIDNINDILAKTGSTARVSDFTSGLESSGKGKGFAYAGGTLSNGATFGQSSSAVGRNNRRGSMSTEEAAAAFAEELKQATLQALQTQAKGGVGKYVAGLGDIDALHGDVLDAAYNKVGKMLTDQANLEERLFNATHDDLAKLNRTREQERAAIDDSNKALLEQVYAAEDMSRTLDAMSKVLDRDRKPLDDKIAQLSELDDLLKNTLTTMRGDSVLGMTRGDARGQLTEALVKARAGVLPKADDISQALGIIASPDSSGYSNFVDYSRSFDADMAKVAELQSLSSGQLTDAQKQLKALEDIYTNAQAQLDKLTGIDISTMTMTSLQAQFNALYAKATAPSAVDTTTYTPIAPSTGSAGVTQQPGFVWTNPDLSGAGAGGPGSGYAVGTNYVPYDMMTMVHEGERITPKWDNPYANPYTSDGADIGPLLSSFNEYRYEQSQANYQLIATMKNILSLFEKWDAQGMPDVDPEWTPA